MPPLCTKPSRRLLQIAAAMYQPLDRKTPISPATSTKIDTKQQRLHLDQVERKDIDPRIGEGPAVPAAEPSDQSHQPLPQDRIR